MSSFSADGVTGPISRFCGGGVCLKVVELGAEVVACWATGPTSCGVVVVFGGGVLVSSGQPSNKIIGLVIVVIDQY